MLSREGQPKLAQAPNFLFMYLHTHFNGQTAPSFLTEDLHETEWMFRPLRLGKFTVVSNFFYPQMSSLTDM